MSHLVCVVASAFARLRSLPTAANEEEAAAALASTRDASGGQNNTFSRTSSGSGGADASIGVAVTLPMDVSKINSAKERQIQVSFSLHLGLHASQVFLQRGRAHARGCQTNVRKFAAPDMLQIWLNRDFRQSWPYLPWRECPSNILRYKI